MDDSIYALNAECEAMEHEISRLESENHELRVLCDDAIAVINRFCEVTDGNTFCPAWPDRERQCLLRDLEDRARQLEVVAGR